MWYLGYGYCDCMKILDEEIDEVKIEFRFKRSSNSIVKTTKIFHLCGDCFKQIYNSNQLEELKKDVK